MIKLNQKLLVFSRSLWLSAQHIVSVGINGDKETIIETVNTVKYENVFIVTETPEEVVALIEKELI